MVWFGLWCVNATFNNTSVNMKPDDSYEDKIVKPKIGGKVCNSINSQTKNRRKGM
jgi:hypothetical protein